jgi:transposase
VSFSVLPLTGCRAREVAVLFAGDDRAEDHHDVEVQDGPGRVLGRARLGEGVAGIGRFHELIGRFADPDAGPDQVATGIETDRGPWVAALIAAGYVVYAVNPRQAARYRERHGTPGAKSDSGDAHMLADMVRTDSHQLRAVAGDSGQAQAVKVAARARQGLVWERTRHVLRLRPALREFFPGALEAFDDLAAPDTLELPGRAPGPAGAARLTVAQITAALKRARRRGTAEKARQIQAALRGQQLAQPEVAAAAYAATVRAAVAVISVLNEQADVMEDQAEAHFGQHPDAEIILSQPGTGKVPGARVLAGLGDDPDRYADARSRKNYAGTSPVTRASGKKKAVLARYVRNRHLADALRQQAFCSLTASPGARAYYDQLRGRGATHHAALRQLASRLTGILHGCLKTGTPCDEAAAWSHRQQTAA